MCVAAQVFNRLYNDALARIDRLKELRQRVRRAQPLRYIQFTRASASPYTGLDPWACVATISE